jgi:NTP pyrophosphatase (non-canonical NTP hydrolase)
MSTLKGIKGEEVSSIALALALNCLSSVCRKEADKWYHDLQTGERIFLNKGERCMLIVTEIAEAFEGERKNLMDDKLPHRRMPEVELADALIRIFDYAGEHGYDLGGALIEKLEYNRIRKDHTDAARLEPNGKKC